LKNVERRDVRGFRGSSFKISAQCEISKATAALGAGVAGCTNLFHPDAESDNSFLDKPSCQTVGLSNAAIPDLDATEKVQRFEGRNQLSGTAMRCRACETDVRKQASNLDPGTKTLAMLPASMESTWGATALPMGYAT
jgi:hypothetical protein